MSRFVPAEQLDLELYRRDGRWRMRVAVGHAGREHALTLGRQDFPITDDEAERICEAARAATPLPSVAGEIVVFHRAPKESA